MSLLGLEEHVENDPCKFVLSCRGSAERFTLQAANTDIKQVWVQHITDLLDLQNKFLSGEKTSFFNVLIISSLKLNQIKVSVNIHPQLFSLLLNIRRSGAALSL